MSRSNGVFIRFVILLISTSVFSRHFSVLATPVDHQRLKRPDPLSHFKPYNGSYDVTNRHYWASAAFTGVHGYANAGIWLLVGFGLGSFVIVKHCLGRVSSAVNRPDSVYITLFSLVVFFTLLAIISSGLILAANERSHKRVNRLIDTIYGAANDASQAMRRVINSLVDMQTHLGPYDQQTSNLLNVTTHRLRRESLLIRKFVDKTRHPSETVVEVLYTTTLAVVIINISMLVAALVLLILHWYPGIMVIIFCCWILTSLIWLLTGLDYFFQTFAHDTCAAFGTFEQNPTNSSLRFIHPCGSPDQSNKILAQIGHTVHDFIFQLNTKLDELKLIFQIEEGKDNITGIREICNPFAGAPNYTYAPQYCAKDATQIGDLSIILSRFTCYNSTYSEECVDGGKFIPESSSEMVGAYIRAIQDLINVFPDLLSLTNCSAVKQAFSDIVKRQCRPLRASVKMLWLSSLSLSTVMMILVSFWVAKIHEDRQRSFAMFHIVPNPV